MFQQLRQLVQQQPQMLESVLQQVAGSNPQLAQLIASNPEQFLQLLAEGEEGDVPMPPGGQNISVTPEERDAIERVIIRVLTMPEEVLTNSLRSCAVWVLSGILSFRRTLLAIRTKNLRPTSYSRTRMTWRISRG